MSGVIIIGSSLVYYYQDELIQRFVTEANKYLNTPVSVGKITVSALENFPDISFSFNEMTVSGSLKGDEKPLLIAKRLTFTLNPFNFIDKNYTIEEVHVEDAFWHMKIDKEGNINYNIIKKLDGPAQGQLTFNLSRITLEQVHFIYSNNKNPVEIDVSTSFTNAKLNSTNNIYDIEAKGKYDIKLISVNGQAYLENKMVETKALLNYDDNNKLLQIEPSTLSLASSEFLTYGKYQFKDSQNIEIYLEGEQTDISTISALLPEKASNVISKYESRGDVYFDLALKGELGNKIGPSLEINFGLIDADLIHPETRMAIKKANVEGYFKSDDINDNVRVNLELKNIRGELEGKEFSSNLIIKNFKDPELNFDFTGSIDMLSLIKFYHPKGLTKTAGLLDIDVSFNGRISNLKSKSLTGQVKTSGQVNLEAVNLSFDNIKLPLENMNGQLLFNNNDVALSDIKGTFGSSDFKLNGYFKNILAFLLLDNEPIGIEANLESRYIDMDELLTTTESDGSSAYRFDLSPRLRLKFDCKVKNLSFRRFHPKKLTGNLLIKDQIAKTDKISFKGLGGQVNLSGMADAQNEDEIKVSTKFIIANVNIDSIFYLFENFNQNFIEDKHLKGKVMADISASMKFDRSLTIDQESLMSTITTAISGGELNNFEPLKKLSKYVDEEALDHLKFSDLSTDIFIKDKTIFLPQMEVKSNITWLKISGTHTFDQHIDYKIITPLRNRKKIDKDEAFGAIEEDKGQSLLYLKITGTASDYKVSYDQAEVKKKIVADLKKEAADLKAAFKNKGEKEKKTIELEEDDYFDWDQKDN
jgi:hypothetical protein